MNKARKVKPETKESWFKAIRILTNKGQVPNRSNLRKERGRGSYDDAQRFIELFSREYPNEWDSAGDKQAPIPAELMPTFGVIWNGAVRQASLDLKDELVEDLQQENSKLREDYKVSEDRANKLEGQVEQQQKQLDQHDAKIDALMQEIAELKASQKAVAPAS